MEENISRIIIENADIIEYLAKVRLSMVNGNTGEVFRIEDKKLVKTGKIVNLPLMRRTLQ
jgi:hypothetical protein